MTAIPVPMPEKTFEYKGGCENMQAVVAEQKRKGLLANEKGLTLIELLAVIVILAIIAAIAVPSIGAIISKTKKEAHRSNAQMIVDAARYAITAEDFPLTKPDGSAYTLGTGQVPGPDPSSNPFTTDTIDVPIGDLVAKGYLESVPRDPENSGGFYDKDNSVVRIHRIQANGQYRYEVKLIDSKNRQVFQSEFVLEADIKTAPFNSGTP
ncbi:MAG TPA: prepilin-type N-terminal cleavage/methylation domain-containing protein [Paenibacillaceae bacterium]